MSSVASPVQLQAESAEGFARLMITNPVMDWKAEAANMFGLTR